MPEPKLTYTLPVKPATMYPINDDTATTKAKGSCVETCSMCTHPDPAEDRIVVSEIGEQ